MSIEFERVGRTFAARVHGVDLQRGIGSAGGRDSRGRVGAGTGSWSFPTNESVTIKQQAFIQQFGPPHEAALKEVASNHPHFYDIGTVDFPGRRARRTASPTSTCEPTFSGTPMARRTSLRSG